MLMLSKIFKTKNFEFCWDFGSSYYRKQIFSDYKNKSDIESENPFKAAQKEKNKEVFDISRKYLHTEILPNLGLNSYLCKNVESDDIVSFLTTKVYKNDEIIIVSMDKDFYQLVDKRVSVYNPITKKIINEDFLIQEYNCNPNKISENFILYKSILGDGSDKIPGVPKCGVKTSIKLARQIIDECIDAKLKEKFLTEEYLELIERNKKLIDFKSLDLISTISIEENINFVKETFKVDKEKAFKTLRDLEINTLYSKLIDFVGIPNG